MKVAVVIVTYNGTEWIEECLHSLRNSTLECTIIVVDNNSSDHTLDIIRDQFPAIKTIPQDTNLGFGRANNIGISYALKQRTEYVFLLNQDTKVEKETLEKLIYTANENPEYGIISPIHYYYKGNELEHYFNIFSKSNLNLENAIEQNDKGLFGLPFVNAAAWLIPSKVLKIVGGFDPIFSHYGEDNNYCQRLKYHGFKVGVISDACIYHDSKKREGKPIELFSTTYFNLEIKQLQIKYANINQQFTTKERNELRLHQLKVIVRNILQFNWSNVIGYLKKYRIFEKEFQKILKSRALNTQKSPNYLNV